MKSTDNNYLSWRNVLVGAGALALIAVGGIAADKLITRYEIRRLERSVYEAVRLDAQGHSLSAKSQLEDTITILTRQIAEGKQTGRKTDYAEATLETAKKYLASLNRGLARE
jgi:hypothetical protein